MTRQDVVAILGKHQPQLRADHGVRSLALFRSVARDEAKPNASCATALCSATSKLMRRSFGTRARPILPQLLNR